MDEPNPKKFPITLLHDDLLKEIIHELFFLDFESCLAFSPCCKRLQQISREPEPLEINLRSPWMTNWCPKRMPWHNSQSLQSKNLSCSSWKKNSKLNPTKVLPKKNTISFLLVERATRTPGFILQFAGLPSILTTLRTQKVLDPC